MCVCVTVPLLTLKRMKTVVRQQTYVLGLSDGDAVHSGDGLEPELGHGLR